jgi:hypothetical protein
LPIGTSRYSQSGQENLIFPAHARSFLFQILRHGVGREIAKPVPVFSPKCDCAFTHRMFSVLAWVAFSAGLFRGAFIFQQTGKQGLWRGNRPVDLQASQEGIHGVVRKMAQALLVQVVAYSIPAPKGKGIHRYPNHIRRFNIKP